MQSDICNGKMNYWINALLFFLRISLLQTLFPAGLKKISAGERSRGYHPKGFPYNR